MHRFLALILLLSIGLPVTAEVYTYIDAEGNRVFTDHPKPGNAKRIQMAPSNSMGQIIPRGPAAAIEAAPIVPPAYQVLRILFPEPDAVLNDGSGNLIVTASSDPGLLPSHNYRLLLDGNGVGAPGRSPVFPLQGLERGTHQLAVEIIDSDGHTLERTPNQPIHVKLISLDQKRRAKPCAKTDYGVRPECPIQDKPADDDDIPFVPFI